MLRVSIASLIAVPFMATVGFAAPETGDFLGNTIDQVSSSLVAAGYAVDFIGFDHDIIDAELSKGDDSYDIDVDPATGLVTDVEIDIDGDGDADGRD